MNKILSLLLALLLSTTLFAYVDSDMDGVADSVDKCPNTPLTDLVDINGCTKKRVSLIQETKGHADIIIGANYAGSNFASLNKSDTYAASLQTDYYYGDFSLQASTSVYKTDSNDYDASGLNDSFIGAAYNFNLTDNITLRLGAGVILPTYDTTLNNNNTDYTTSLNLSYALEKINLFGGYSYTMINDDDVVDANNDYRYQDTNAYSAGIGYYFSNSLYMSGAYNFSDSIYVGIEEIKSASLYGYYAINKNRFLIFTYAYGLSESASDNALSVKVGYYF